MRRRLRRRLRSTPAAAVPLQRLSKQQLPQNRCAAEPTAVCFGSMTWGGGWATPRGRWQPVEGHPDRCSGGAGLAWGGGCNTPPPICRSLGSSLRRIWGRARAAVSGQGLLWGQRYAVPQFPLPVLWQGGSCCRSCTTDAARRTTRGQGGEDMDTAPTWHRGTHRPAPQPVVSPGRPC